MEVNGTTAAPGDGPALRSLEDRARWGMIWNTGFSLLRDGLQFFLMVVLARLLTPGDYGQFNMVTDLLGFLMVFSFRPFLGHTLQLGRDQVADYDLHFSAGVAIQLGLFLFTLGLAAALRWWPVYAPVGPLLALKSLTFLLDLPSELRIKMLERELNWKRLRILHSVGVVASGAISLGMAAAGCGVWALVAPPLVVHVPFAYDLFVNERWRPGWEWSLRSYRPALRFGFSRMASGLVASGRKLIESGLLVQVVGFGGFGLFGRAIGLAQMVAFKFAYLFLQSLYPLLPQLDGERSRRAGALILQGVGWVVIPGGTLLAVLADPAIRIVYGRQWLAAIPLLSLAAAAGVAGALGYAAYSILLAGQEQRRCLLIDLLGLAGTAVALAVLAPIGLPAYLKGLVVLQLASLILMLRWLYREAAVNGMAMAVGLVQPAVAAAGAALACEGMRRLIWTGEWTAVSAAVCALTFAAVHLAVLRLLFVKELTEIVRLLPGGKRLGRVLALGK